MLISLIVAILTCLSIVITSVLKPTLHLKGHSFNLYWTIALFGAILILATNTLSINEWWSGLIQNNGINPLQILVLFLSMSLISIFLDELGFFAHLANWILQKVRQSQIILFTVFYIFVAILTMFTSNDIIILTLTPFILFFCKNAKISPIPYLVSEFIAANTWSMIFIIGNPTNIYLASAFNISFIDYFKVMCIPTLLTGVAEFLLLFAIFYKKLQAPISKHTEVLEPENIPLTIIGLTILIVCTVFLIISSYINLPMYLISVCSLGLLVIIVLIYSLVRKRRPIELGHTFIRGPYEIIPFIIGMFTLVLALNKYGVTANISKFFGDKYPTLVYGYTSMIFSNLFNNIPMSVLYSSITANMCSGANQLAAVYASIVGSNIGAFITPLGALAGIMWLNIVKQHNISFKYIDFMKYGIIVGLPAITITLFSLLIFV